MTNSLTPGQLLTEIDRAIQTLKIRMRPDSPWRLAELVCQLASPSRTSASTVPPSNDAPRHPTAVLGEGDPPADAATQITKLLTIAQRYLQRLASARGAGIPAGGSLIQLAGEANSGQPFTLSGTRLPYETSQVVVGVRHPNGGVSEVAITLTPNELNVTVNASQSNSVAIDADGEEPAAIVLEAHR
ncbi:hypothetical protein IU469_30965 [Nocardia puris]|uniref:hypothetical protein n=1 Tax=Nocardia puris TaxID=208602 RepID=UPI0018933EB0|nr:hypothetical protein [Nocardia puris]MBF6370096.1 hypothetical protein [Nocardia puris]